MTLYTNQEQDTSDEYATKPELWRPLGNAVGGFDLDPAAGAENSPIADTVYTESDDGLTSEWFGSVWLNPPFSAKLEWFRKAVNEVGKHTDIVVAIAPVDTSTQWFQRWFSKAEYFCWLEGRDWYVAEGSPSFNTVVGVFGGTDGQHDALKDVLHAKGTVTEPITNHTQETLC